MVGHARGVEGGRKNGRSRGTEPRHGSHASTPITRDSLTIGFPLAVTEIYRKLPSPHLLHPPTSELGRFRESAVMGTKKKEKESIHIYFIQTLRDRNFKDSSKIFFNKIT